ncbi:MAG TPA: Gfo/Idh/MocA family oxidoreductase, partial [Capsulimonadaceae bacterium]|nr:Gfo/Idh/MocA family oxidoreductase [Capsulimonadaceae bacterium]
ATCDAGKDRKIEAETVAAAVVRLKNGALGTITGTTLSYDGFDQRVLICGSEGSASFATDRLLSMKTKRPYEEIETTDADTATGVASGSPSVASEPLALWSDMHKANIKDFITSIQAGKQPMVKPEEMRRVVRVLNMIYSKAGVGPYAGKKY